MDKVIDWLQLGLLTWLLCNLLASDSGIFTYVHLRNNVRGQLSELERINEHLSQLQDRIYWLEQDSDYHEMVARTHWGFIRDDEFNIWLDQGDKYESS